jgi:hypothetical protein
VFLVVVPLKENSGVLVVLPEKCQLDAEDNKKHAFRF